MFLFLFFPATFSNELLSKIFNIINNMSIDILRFVFSIFNTFVLTSVVTLLHVNANGISLATSDSKSEFSLISNYCTCCPISSLLRYWTKWLFLLQLQHVLAFALHEVLCPFFFFTISEAIMSWRMISFTLLAFANTFCFSGIYWWGFFFFWRSICHLCHMDFCLFAISCYFNAFL